MMMQEVLVHHVMVNFHSWDKDQRYDKRTDTYIKRLRDAAVSCNYIIECKCSCNKKTVVDFYDRRLRDCLLVGLYDDDV